MKVFTRFLFVFVWLCYSVACHSQENDSRIIELLDQMDLLELDRELSVAGKRISPFLFAYSRVFTLDALNKKEACSEACRYLIENFHDELDIGSMASVLIVWAGNLSAMNRYKEAASLLTNFLENAEGLELPVDIINTITGHYRIADALSKYPGSYLKRPGRKVELPILRAPHDNGINGHLYIKGTVDGEEVPFIFDTGCGRTFVSEQFATKYGVEVVVDSISILGSTGISYSKLGFLKELNFGEIIYYNIPVAIFPGNELDSIYGFNAVLGFDFLEQFGDIQLLPDQQKIIFSSNDALTKGTEPNCMLFSTQPYIEGYISGERQLFQFDTGSGFTSLSSQYLSRHLDDIVSDGKLSSANIGGFSGIQSMVTYELPYAKIELGGKTFTVENIPVITQPMLIKYGKMDGTIGVDFVNALHSVTMNFRNMVIVFD